MSKYLFDKINSEQQKVPNLARFFLIYNNFDKLLSIFNSYQDAGHPLSLFFVHKDNIQKSLKIPVCISLKWPCATMTETKTI